MSRADETLHIKGFIRTQVRDTKTGRYMLPKARTVLIGVARKRRRPAGNVNHLTLVKCFVKILGEPDGPLITQSLFSSSVGIIIIVHCKHSKTPLYIVFYMNRQIQRPALLTPKKSLQPEPARATSPFSGCKDGNDSAHFFTDFSFCPARFL
jgi:hypothetical protein